MKWNHQEAVGGLGITDDDLRENRVGASMRVKVRWMCTRRLEWENEGKWIVRKIFDSERDDWVKMQREQILVPIYGLRFVNRFDEKTEGQGESGFGRSVIKIVDNKTWVAQEMKKRGSCWHESRGSKWIGVSMKLKDSCGGSSWMMKLCLSLRAGWLPRNP